MKIYQLVFVSVGTLAFSSAAHAQLVVKGKGNAALCYEYALRGNQGSHSALRTCSEGLSEYLWPKDEAATFVNRGILHMRKGNQTAASADFQAAIALKPELTEAYVNYGASLIKQKKFDAALVALETALDDEDSPTRPQALYNRAIIKDHRENYKGAYFDLKSALAIRPDWTPALKLLDRYDVRPAG